MIQIFIHCNDIDYIKNGEEALLDYKIGQKITAKILEINKADYKVRGGIKQCKKSPMDFFKEKGLKVGDVLTVKVLSSDNRGINVRPEGFLEELSFHIKKSNLAVAVSDQRGSRWNPGDRCDVAIAELNLEKNKVVFSIKLLEETQKKIALEKWGHSDSGKNLPFKNLSDDIKKDLSDKLNKKKKS